MVVSFDFLKPLLAKNENKIVLLVMDGLGGLPDEFGKTTLESAYHPNLDKMAKEGITGSSHPVSPGITPGSGPSHFALFGYDPIKYDIGRGVLEALGVGLTMTPLDVAARANFSSFDAKGNITDRRAGRITTETNEKLVQKLKDNIKKIEDVEIILQSGKEHRFVIMFRGPGLGDNITETDPQGTGMPALPIKALNPESEKMARIADAFTKKAHELLKNDFPANGFLVRGISKYPAIPNMSETFGVNPAAIATYPMYKGLASLVGMKLLKTPGEAIADEFTTLEQNWQSYDFFYVHIKKTDSYGEDGNFKAKTKIIEEVDTQIPRLLKLKPSVVLVTCDHSTPVKMKAHSWHPCPVLLWAPETCQPDDVTVYGERACMKGGLGIMNHLDLMPLMLAHALRLHKYGA